MNNEKESIIETILKVMNDVGAVGKDGYNKSQNFKFRGVDPVINACSPAMKKHGLLAIPTVLEREDATGKTSTGKTMLIVRLKVKYTWVNRHGDSLETTVVSEANDTADKGTAKAMSVALRIAYLQTLVLPTDEPDPNESYVEHGTQGQQQPQVALPTKEQVDAAAAALNVDMLAKMETAAGTAGDAQARAYIGSARLMAKRQLEQNNNQGEQQ